MQTSSAICVLSQFLKYIAVHYPSTQDYLDGWDIYDVPYVNIFTMPEGPLELTEYAWDVFNRFIEKNVMIAIEAVALDTGARGGGELYSFIGHLQR
jgi:hypothetical protein